MPDRRFTQFQKQINDRLRRKDLCPVTEALSVSLREDTQLAENNVRQYVYEIINRAQCPFSQKEGLYKLIMSGAEKSDILATMQTTQINDALKSAISEILLA